MDPRTRALIDSVAAPGEQTQNKKPVADLSRLDSMPGKSVSERLINLYNKTINENRSQTSPRQQLIDMNSKVRTVRELTGEPQGRLFDEETQLEDGNWGKTFYQFNNPDRPSFNSGTTNPLPVQGQLTLFQRDPRMLARGEETYLPFNSATGGYSKEPEETEVKKTLNNDDSMYPSM